MTIQKIITPVLALTCAITLAPLTTAQTRKWTSADGSKTFPADFISYNSSTQTVTVMKGFKKITFNVSKLSKADQTWIADQEAKKAKNNSTSSNASSGENIIGNQISKGILSKLSGKRYKRYTLKEPMPEYYMICFSASW